MNGDERDGASALDVSAAEPLDQLDDLVLARLRDAFALIDPPPPRLADETKVLITWSQLDAELALLTEDAAVALRGTQLDTVDTVTFTSSWLSLMISVSDDLDARRVDGWITGGGLQVELHVGSEVRVAESDAQGRLVWPDVPPGPMRFLIHPAGSQRAVITPVVDI